MAAPTVVSYQDVDVSAIQFSAGKEIKSKPKDGASGSGGGGSGSSVGGLTVHNITYKSKPLYVRFPPCVSPIGLRKNMGDKWTVPITFTNADPLCEKRYGAEAHETPDTDPYAPAGNFYNFLMDFQAHVHKSIAANATEWLSTSAPITEKRAAEITNAIVKPHMNKVEGVPSGKYPPTFTLEVGRVGANFDLTARDVDKKLLPVGYENILAAFKGGVHFRGVFLVNGLFYTNSKFTVTFTLQYAELTAPMRSVARPTATSLAFDLLEDTEEERAAQTANKKARADDGATATSFMSTSRPNKAAGAW
jgi:hypothetical protein